MSAKDRFSFGTMDAWQNAKETETHELEWCLQQNCLVAYVWIRGSKVIQWPHNAQCYLLSGDALYNVNTHKDKEVLCNIGEG